MINLTGLELLTHRRTNEFWGDNLRFQIRDEFNFQGKILDLYNQSGARGVLTQLSGQNNVAIDYDPIIVNGTFLGLGQINNINYEQGVDVRLANFTLSATVFNSGNTSQMDISDPLYSGVNLSSQLFPIYLIENFSEQFDSEVLEDGTYSENQRITLKFISGAANGNIANPISMAQQFASNLISSNPIIPFVNNFYSGFSQKPGKRTATEVYDVINNTVNVNRIFKTLRDISGSYSINYTNSLQVDAAGITNIKESARVQGLIPDQFGNYYYSAFSGAQYEANTNSFNRCDDVFNTYQGAPAYPLNTRFITYGQTLNKFLDTVNYEITYSNDPKINNLYSWEYIQSAERDKTECTYRVTEAGTIQGYSTECTPAQKYPNAVIGYMAATTGLYLRSYNFYTGFSMFAQQIYPIDQSESADRIRGIIKYSQTFTDNLIYTNSGVKKLVVNVDDDFSVPYKNIFNIPNYKQIAQVNNLMTLARRNVNISMAGFRWTVITGYMGVAQNVFNLYVPNWSTVIDPYISSLEYTWNPRGKSFTLQGSYTYYDSGINLNQFLIS